MTNPTIPHGTMTVAKARKKWEAVYRAAQSGDPAAMLDAAQEFSSIAEAMFIEWSKT